MGEYKSGALILYNSDLKGGGGYFFYETKTNGHSLAHIFLYMYMAMGRILSCLLLDWQEGLP